MIKILLVCMGNICRSPMAEGILRDLAKARGLSIATDSAGTINSHVGEAPDHRAAACMVRHGSDISDLRARQVKPHDFHEFDLLLAMDRDNLEGLLRIVPEAELIPKAKLMMDYVPTYPMREVPDPYFGGDEGFEAVHKMVTAACTNLLNKLETDVR